MRVVSAEIPWACGPGEVLPKAPAPKCTCGSGGHPRHCSAHPWAFDEHVADLNAPDPEDARTDAEALADLEVNELRYTQAQWDERERADAAERDRWLLDLQKARAAAKFWEDLAQGQQPTHAGANCSFGSCSKVARQFYTRPAESFGACDEHQAIVWRFLGAEVR